MGNITNKIYDKIFAIFRINYILSFKYISKVASINELFQKLIVIEKERDRLFEELKLREQAWNNLMLAMFDWVWITDKYGRYSYVSPKLKDIYGYTNGDMLGKMPHEYLEGQYREDVIKLEQYLIESHEKLMNYESESRKADGTKIRTTTSCVPLFGNDGDYIGHVGVEKIIN